MLCRAVVTATRSLGRNVGGTAAWRMSAVASVRRMSSYTAHKVLTCEGDGSDRRTATGYKVTKEEIEAYHTNGYISLPGVCTQEEVDELEAIYNMCINGEVEIPGKDFCGACPCLACGGACRRCSGCGGYECACALGYGLWGRPKRGACCACACGVDRNRSQLRAAGVPYACSYAMV